MLAGMYRIGQGYDSHRLVPGRPLVLAGVPFDHELGLAGHSDADVVFHAVTDAVLGAVAAGDIGEHFPDSDPRWAGAGSGQFLLEAVRLAREAGYDVCNCDVTVLAERPRLGAHKSGMRANLAGALGCEAAAVSVKAKTNEQMGAVGRGEGISAQAVVLLRRRTGSDDASTG